MSGGDVQAADPARLRPARAEDAAALAALAERTFRATFAEFNSAADMDRYCAESYGAPIQRAQIEASDGLTLLASLGDRLLGYAQLRFRHRHPSVPASVACELQRLYVDADWHGRGLAPRLMQACIEQARAAGSDVLWLGVWEHNPRAIAFYRKYGFEVTGEHEFVLGADRQRDLVMALRLAAGD